MLHGRASLRPDEVAFTFTDYTDNPLGAVERVTWSQLSRRTRNAAAELRRHARVGDRAVILAPQGMAYIIAFLGSMQAGLIAVPLPLPHRGSSHDRVSTVFEDTEPAVVLTTAAVASDVGEFLGRACLSAVPKLIEMESMDLDGPEPESLPGSGFPGTAYLQYSSGSTRQPTGVMVSHQNLQANFEQLMHAMFAAEQIPTNGATIVSWLPFYHDMGLVLGVCAPILGGYPADLSSPVAFLEKPARWMRALASNPKPFSAAPNFAFDLAARKTRDSDLAGLDLGGVLGIINGAERVDPATLDRFADRFSHFNFADRMLRPSYGLAEATVFVASGVWSESTGAIRFDPDELSAGRAKRATGPSGVALVRYRPPIAPLVRIVDADTRRGCPSEVVGEIWVHGGNVTAGYWGRPEGEQAGFHATLADPSPGTPAGPWLRTGDLGFLSGGELFIVGRIKDLLIIRGRNHYPEDIEATVQQVSGGRVAAFAVADGGTEKLVTVIEVKERGDTPDAVARWLRGIRDDVAAAVSNAHGLSAGDVVLVAPGSIPTTTSGKIRRVACAEEYRNERLIRLG